MKWLSFALAFYGICTLGSMATMSVGFWVSVLALLAAARGPKAMGRAIQDQILGRDPALLRFFRVSALLAIVCALSLLIAMVLPYQVGPQRLDISPARDFLKLMYLFWPFVLGAGFRLLPGPERSRVLKSWLLVFGILSAVGCMQFFTGWPRQQRIPGFDGFFHSTLFIGHHLSVASIWIFPFFIVLEGALSRHRTWRSGVAVWSRGALLLFALLGLATLVLGFSRTAWIALAVSVSLWVFLQIRSNAVRAAVVGIVVLASWAVWQTEPVQRRFRDSLGFTERMEVWRGNLSFVEEHPWFGIGFLKSQEAYRIKVESTLQPGQRAFVGHAHSLPLEMAAGTGGVGLIVFLLWVGMLFSLILSLNRDGSPDGWTRNALLCAFLAFFINGLTQVNLWDAKVTHQVAWVLGWLLAFRADQERSA